MLDRVFMALDEPFADASAVPTYFVSEATRKEVTVVLTGDGADEVFGGYRRYWSELHAGLWNHSAVASPPRGVPALLRQLPESKDQPAGIASPCAPFCGYGAMPTRCGGRRPGCEWHPSRNSIVCLEPRCPALRLWKADRRFARAHRESDPINAMLAADVAFELPGDMLTKVDRTSMAHALETRTPFLDQRVVEWAFALPGESKLALTGGRPVGKRILRTAFADRLPAEVFDRPKRGFEMPVAAMLEGPAAQRLAAEIDPAALARQGLFDLSLIADWRRELAAGWRDTSWQLWTVLAFQEWARVHRRPEALA